MTRLTLTMLAGAGLLGAQATAARPVPKSYKDIKYPALNPVKIPKIERATLPNGIKVYLVEDHELPLFHAQAFVPGGDHQDPDGKTGLASVTSEVMRTGGSVSRPGDQLDKELDRLPATVETSADDDSVSATISCLKENAPAMLAVLNDLLRNPAFPEDKIELAKNQIRAGIERRNDETTQILYREMSGLLYGKGSPFAREVEYATLDAIRRDDLVAYHKRYFQPDTLTIGVWGDFNAAAMKSEIEKVFGSWPKGGQPKPTSPKVDMAKQSKGVFHATKEDVTQSWIQMAFLLDLKRTDPDYPAMVVAMQVLGGGFGSRMFDSIRTTQGLAYAASAGYSPHYVEPGVLRAMIGVENKNVLKGIEAAKAEIAKFKDKGITADELNRAKDSFLKSDAFNYDSVGKILGRQMVYEYYGYPVDTLERVNRGIRSVTADDVLRVARKYIDESKFAILAVGKSSEFKEQLASLGRVIEVDIGIPQPSLTRAAPATADSAAKAKALLTRARGFHGGEALAKLQSYSTKVEMTMVTPAGENQLKAEGLVSLAGKSRLSINNGMVVQVFDGSALWMKSPQGVQQAPSQFAAEAKITSLRETAALLSNWDKPGYTVSAVGVEKLDGKDAEAVLISNEAARLQVKVYMDPGTGALVGKAYKSQGADAVEVLSDLRDVDGIKVAFRSVRTANGKKAAEMRIQEFKVNPGAPDSAFSKPE